MVATSRVSSIFLKFLKVIQMRELQYIIPFVPFCLSHFCMHFKTRERSNHKYYSFHFFLFCIKNQTFYFIQNIKLHFFLLKSTPYEDIQMGEKVKGSVFMDGGSNIYDDFTIFGTPTVRLSQRCYLNSVYQGRYCRVHS